MTTDDDERAISLAILLRRVEEVADASPSLDALYALEPSFEYYDFWYPVRELLRQRCEARGSQEAWRAELHRPAPDPVMWLGHHRRDATPAGLQDAARQWSARGPERLFAPHHHVPGVLEGVAAVHVVLLADLDPVGAVEYAAGLPSEYFVWPAANRIQISERQDLVDRVLAESCSRDAVLLCLACVLDEQCSNVRRLASDRRWNDHNEDAVAAADTALEGAWTTSIPHRHRQLAATLVHRDDAGAVLGPWIRHLVRCVDRSVVFDEDETPRVAMVALEQVLATVPEGSTIELDRVPEPDAACLVARMLTNNTRATGHWEEWQALLLAEHDSLHSCHAVAWQTAARALLRFDDPQAVWVQTVRVLQSILRRRARRHPNRLDPVVHLVMPGMYASAFLGLHGAPLWLSVVELARRHFLVDRPRANEPRYWLCADVFAAFPGIFKQADELDRALALLPTSAHVRRARERVSSNAILIAASSD